MTALTGCTHSPRSATSYSSKYVSAIGRFTVDYPCGGCSAVLMHADEDQARTLIMDRAPPELSPQQFFFERIAVGRHGRSADIRVPRKRLFKCLKLRFFGSADHKSLI
jgi:hypothetical protein